jgi:methyl-accepting chemotaxis protein
MIRSMRWKNIKIRNKLTFGFGVIILFSGLIIFQSISNMNKMAENSEEVKTANHIKQIFTERYNDHLKWSNKISYALLSANGASLGVETNPHNCAFGKWFYGEGRSKTENLMPGIEPILDSLEILHLNLHHAAEEMNEFLSENSKIQAIEIFNSKVTRHLQDIGLKIQSINKEISKNNERIDRHSQTENRAAKVRIILTGFIAILISIALAWLITASLTKGINIIVKASHQISEGELDIAIDAQLLKRKDEIGELLESFRYMSDKLKSIVGSIVVAADNIATAGLQISSTTEQLSQGANEQAASVEEISSTMEEISSNTQQNAANATQDDQIASLASANINKSNESVKSTTQSINDITNKISIINDIAFQTNILALNAAVQAAHAGMQGRSFAVVAVEVRKLAERCREAADEINKLSANGVSVAKVAVKQFDEIIPEMELTAKLVQEISSSSGEQNAGIDQVSSSIQLLNMVAQQNAAASEEMVTSAEELANQAEKLKQIVSFFRIEKQQVIKESLAISEEKNTGPIDDSSIRNDAKIEKVQLEY